MGAVKLSGFRDEKNPSTQRILDNQSAGCDHCANMIDLAVSTAYFQQTKRNPYMSIGHTTLSQIIKKCVLYNGKLYSTFQFINRRKNKQKVNKVEEND